jgi:hypothetical protein
VKRFSRVLFEKLNSNRLSRDGQVNQSGHSYVQAYSAIGASRIDKGKVVMVRASADEEKVEGHSRYFPIELVSH